MREKEYEGTVMSQRPREDGVLRRKLHQEFYQELLKVGKEEVLLILTRTVSAKAEG